MCLPDHHHGLQQHFLHISGTCFASELVLTTSDGSDLITKDGAKRASNFQ